MAERTATKIELPELTQAQMVSIYPAQMKIIAQAGSSEDRCTALRTCS